MGNRIKVVAGPAARIGHQAAHHQVTPVANLKLKRHSVAIGHKSVRRQSSVIPCSRRRQGILPYWQQFS